MIYPNPNAGRFTIFLKSNDAVSIEIICSNLLGQTLFSKEYDLANGALKAELDLSAVGKGLYLVQVRNKGQSVSRKVIIGE